MQLDVMAFGAHADDFELGCGATIAKLCNQGYAVGACDLTKGELSTRGSVEERLEEAQMAADILGLKTRIALDIPDGNIEVNQTNRMKVIRTIRQFRPRYLFLNYWKCRHFDHIHASNLVSEAAFYSGLRKIDTGQEPFRPSVIFYYFLRHEFEPSFIVDVSEVYPKKLEAIKAHRTQFYNPDSQEPETFISSSYFLDSIENRNKYFGLRIGAEYGEPFLVKETVKIDDPVRHFDSLDAMRIMSSKD
jgi:bacillithiol biosynthesis deacetylase BshB1